MKTENVVRNLKSRIKYLEVQDHLELGEHPYISGLKEAVRIIEKLEESRSIDWTLQTR